MAAPIGNSNARKGKMWHGAIVNALARRTRERQQDALEELADRLIEACATGDLPALKELGDRLDGKPAQAIVNGEDGAFAIEVAKRIIVDPGERDA